jgi:hypothetical protein
MSEIKRRALEIRNSEAFSIRNRIEALQITFSIFRRNSEDLQRLLEGFRTAEPRVPVWNIDRRGDLDTIGHEIGRLLHNYVAAAMTIREHTRNLIRYHYEGAEFINLYQAQIDMRFTDNHLARFIQHLRIYMLHYALPYMQAQLQILPTGEGNQVTLESSMLLDPDALLEWKNWDQYSRDFIESQADGINIATFVSEYTQMVLDFHIWLDATLQELHKDELDWLEKKGTELLELGEKEGYPRRSQQP